MNATQALLVSILAVVVFGVGFMLGSITDDSGFIAKTNSSSVAAKDVDSEAARGTSSPGTSVNVASLTEGQRQILRALGIDDDEVTITPEMVACAEAKLGTPRIEEIKNGATPSFSEGVALVACYR